jgi:WD40 repeat protein
MTRDIILVSAGYDMCIRFWSDFNESKCKHSIEYKDAAINALEITPNKEYVAFGSQNSIKFIDLGSLNSTPVYSIDSHEGIVSNILFPLEFENCFISAGEDSSVKINDIRTCKAVKEFFHNNYVNSIAVANNNVI